VLTLIGGLDIPGLLSRFLGRVSLLKKCDTVFDVVELLLLLSRLGVFQLNQFQTLHKPTLLRASLSYRFYRLLP